ncbi:MAG: hypothetical protein K8L99_18315 [Anaerolineae bacterium]|nr:hypothetical protein [Anaerolineae bacterium]
MRKVTILALLAVLGVFAFGTVQAQGTGFGVVITSAEYITDPLSGEPGGVEWIQRDLGNAQTGQDFVYNDPRRALFNGGQPGVTFGVNTGFQSADAGLGNQIGWMYQAVGSWDNLACSDMGLVENAITSGAPGVVARYFQTGVINLDWESDMTQVGFLSGAQFPYFAANTNVLGVTFTLSWTDEEGNLTDIDGNGKSDVAFREIYYNDEFEWVDNGVQGVRGDGFIDFPAVAIHEVGHGFSAAHFGNIGRQDGVLVARPRAIMNAIYGGIARDLTGRDNGSHCSNWANWPIH